MTQTNKLSQEELVRQQRMDKARAMQGETFSLSNKEKARYEVIPYLQMVAHILFAIYQNFPDERDLYTSQKNRLQKTEYDRRTIIALMCARFVNKYTHFYSKASDRLLLQVWYFLGKDKLIDDMVLHKYKDNSKNNTTKGEIAYEIKKLSRCPEVAEVLVSGVFKEGVSNAVNYLKRYSKTIPGESYWDILFLIFHSEDFDRSSPLGFVIYQAIKNFIDKIIPVQLVSEKLFDESMQVSKLDFDVRDSSQRIAKDFFTNSKSELSSFDLVSENIKDKDRKNNRTELGWFNKYFRKIIISKISLGL